MKIQNTQNPIDSKVVNSLPKSVQKNYKNRVRHRVCRIVTRDRKTRLLSIYATLACWLGASVNYHIRRLLSKLQAFETKPLAATAVQPVNRRTARPGLRSENSQNYYVPRVRTKLAERAFSYAWTSRLEQFTRGRPC